MAESIKLTQHGFDEKEERLNYLIKVRRPQCVEAIKVAREFGDLSENAEYDAAKDEQGRVEDEIRFLENLLANVEIIADEASDAIVVGSKFVLYDVDFEEEHHYSLVSTVEADFTAGKISNGSPLGKALLGKKAGEIVNVVGPNGNNGGTFRIVRIGD